MANDIAVTEGVGRTVAADEVSTKLHQLVKPVYGIDGAVQRVDGTHGLPIQVLGDSYETVAASQTDQVMGGSGAAGDKLAGVLVIPANTSPGHIQIKDGGGSAITVFTGGASSVSNLVPFFIPLNIVSGSGGWKLTTGADVSAIGIGKFT